jgi:hypothetical protein
VTACVDYAAGPGGYVQVRRVSATFSAPGGTAPGGTAYFPQSGGRFADGESLTVTLLAAGPHAAGPVPAAEVEVVLTDPAFGCAAGSASPAAPAAC